MIVNKYNQGGGGSGSGMTPQQVQQQIDTSLNPYWDSGETKDYVDEAVSGISLEGYYTSAQTEEAIISKGYASQDQVDEIDEVVAESLNDLQAKIDELSGATPSIDLSGYYTSAQTEERIASAYTILDEHITEVEQVTSSAYTELHDDIIELSARTIPDMSLYTPTTGFSTINGSAITEGGNIKISVPDMSAYYTSAQTDAAIATAKNAAIASAETYTDSAITMIQDQLDDIDEVIPAALVDLNERVTVLEVSGGTPSVDLSGYYTSAQTQEAITEAVEGFAYEEDVEEIAEVTAGAINTLQTDVSEKTEFRKHVYVSLDDLTNNESFQSAFFDVNEDDDPVSYITLSKAGELIDIAEMRSDAAYTISIDPSSYLIWYDAEENNGDVIPAGFYSLAFSKGDEGENFTNVPFRVAIGGSDSEDIEALNVTTTTGSTVREAIAKYNNEWSLKRDGVFIVEEDGFPTEWFFKDDVKHFEIAFTDDGEGNFMYEVNIEYANTVHSDDLDGYVTSADTTNFITSAYVADQHFLTSADTANYVTSGQVETQITGKHYVTSSDLSGYYTSAQTQSAITAATQNMVTSTTITTMWKGTQAEYDTLTNSGATADSGTFYVVIPDQQ